MNQCDAAGKTPLMGAAYNGHARVVELLLGREDVEVDTANAYGETPLYMADVRGHARVAELIRARMTVARYGSAFQFQSGLNLNLAPFPFKVRQRDVRRVPGARAAGGAGAVRPQEPVRRLCAPLAQPAAGLPRGQDQDHRHRPHRRRGGRRLISLRAVHLDLILFRL